MFSPSALSLSTAHEQLLFKIALVNLVILNLINLTPLDFESRVSSLYSSMLSSCPASSCSFALNMPIDHISLLHICRSLRSLLAPTLMCLLKWTHLLAYAYLMLSYVFPFYLVLLASFPVLAVTHFFPSSRLSVCCCGGNDMWPTLPRSSCRCGCWELMIVDRQQCCQCSVLLMNSSFSMSHNR